MQLFHNNRFYILLLSVLFSLGAYYFAQTTYGEGLQIIRLTQIYAFSALILLYIALLLGPLLGTFPTFPFKEQLKHARRAIGVSAFYFALLHACFAFFGQLGGFEGLAFLTANYLTAAGLGAIALFILMLLAFTSFDGVIKRMGFANWKFLQRFIYISGIAILIHVILVGTHYQDFVAFVPQVTFVAVAFLFGLEALRLDNWLKERFDVDPQLNYASLVIVALVVIGAWYVFVPVDIKGGTISSHGHSGSAKSPVAAIHAGMPGMQGDRTLRFNTALVTSDAIAPNNPTDIRFNIANAANGAPVNLYKKVMDKEAHLIIVDSSFEHFDHIHPMQQGNGFDVSATFPKDDTYHAYLTYQPVNAIEQETAFAIQVGKPEEKEVSKPVVDTVLTKTVGKYEVTMKLDKQLTAAGMNNAEDSITFTIKDSNSKKPVNTLKPYIGAFGHLVMINTQSYAYMHIHPKDMTPPKPNQNGGPEVAFLPVMIQDPIKPGIYRLFAEFNPNNERIVADFTVKVN